jgi:hypothetical protein
MLGPFAYGVTLQLSVQKILPTQARMREKAVREKKMGVVDFSTTPRGWPAKHGGLGGMGMAGRHNNAPPSGLVPHLL